LSGVRACDVLFTATSERRIDASPQRVFRMLVDAERYPTWLGGARDVVVDDDRWPNPGSGFHHEVGVGPIDVHDSATVVGLEPWRRLDLVVRARPFLVADVRFELEPAGSGSCVRMTERPRGLFRLASPFISPLVRLRNDRSLARLSRQLEEHESL